MQQRRNTEKDRSHEEDTKKTNFTAHWLFHALHVFDAVTLRDSCHLLCWPSGTELETFSDMSSFAQVSSRFRSNTRRRSYLTCKKAQEHPAELDPHPPARSETDSSRTLEPSGRMPWYGVTPSAHSRFQLIFSGSISFAERNCGKMCWTSLIPLIQATETCCRRRLSPPNRKHSDGAFT